MALAVGIGAAKAPWGFVSQGGNVLQFAVFLLFAVYGTQWRKPAKKVEVHVLSDAALMSVHEALGGDVRDLLFSLADNGSLRIEHLNDLIQRDRDAQALARYEADAVETLARRRKMLGIEGHDAR